MDTKDLEKRVNKMGGISYWKEDVLVGKKCCRCGEDKEISEFSYSNKKKGIFKGECKSCNKERQQYWYENNKEYDSERKKRYNRENLEKVRERWRQRDHKKYYREHKEQILANQKAYKERQKKLKAESSKCYEEFKGEILEKRINKKYGNITYWKDDVMIYKQCSKCKEIKDVKEFSGIKKKNSSCKDCVRKYNEKTKEHRIEYYNQNKEHYKETNKQWRENNLEYVKEYVKEYREKNKEKIAKNWQKYYAENKDNIKAREKEQKEKCLKEIKDVIKQINHILKELNLSVYGYIYKIENIKTNRVYIGQTTQLLKDRYGSKEVIKGWIKERKTYENQKFVEELIEEDFEVTEFLDAGCCAYHLDKLESYYINKYDSCNNGYNNNNGYWKRDDGIEEFNQILSDHNLEFKDGKLIKKAPTNK